jgi:hypothetical protein
MAASSAWPQILTLPWPRGQSAKPGSRLDARPHLSYHNCTYSLGITELYVFRAEGTMLTKMPRCSELRDQILALIPTTINEVEDGLGQGDIFVNVVPEVKLESRMKRT